jgi:hypothetical protein
VFRASRPAKPSLAPSLAIVKAASVAFQPLVPDWKLPFGSRLLESARARGDNGSERTANRTTAPAVLPSGRARVALSRCVFASCHRQSSPSDLMIRPSDERVPATVNGPRKRGWRPRQARVSLLPSTDYQPGGVDEFGVGWLAMYRDTSAKVNAFGPDPTA